MADVHLQPPRRARRTPTVPLTDAVLAVALIAAALALAFLATRSPPRVDRVVVANPSDNELLVEVRGTAEDPWMPLAIVAPHQSKTELSVIDQGERWLFRLTSHGRDAGAMELDRGRLVAQGWQVEITPVGSLAPTPTTSGA